jgi:putative RecB family exonuclease
MANTQWPVEPARLEKVKTMPRSVSQVKSYLPELGGCPYGYYLDRVVRVWNRPAAWSPQGTADHEAFEAWERSGRTMSQAEAEDVFRQAYAREINELAEETPNLDAWFSSGPYHGEADTERRYNLGLEQVGRYIDYYTKTAPEEVIWVAPDGTPGIELAFDFDLDGVQMRGFIDAVVMVRPPLPDKPKTASGAVSKSKASQDEWQRSLYEWGKLPDVIRVRDNKTGNKPGDSFQLGGYAVAIEERYDVEVADGDYWMGRAGKPTKPYELMDREGITELVHRADAGIKAEQFEPNPEESRCMFCSVRTACAFSAYHD